ncbi:flagellar hook-length control protein FliK [Neptuniibacter caesariensis]|uniref:Flagellar hook-length control protein FliK n=1 Tax=Neptuniibacter caesariensis TaxID=207954 RepID=A0A7U8C633_NEPCE|nr:flagellar hook-length control protein FliK [Neptuniibacter caesariensis]EAR60574.1 flagellar hook-length control protein FliK [Oceanospirillum sp. MED92] [Neptuniibacter caesariensis]
MSEQILSSAAGGVLSLNLSVMPQGGASGQSGGVPLFTGFSSMLNQQSSSQHVSAEFDSGVVLPSEGVTLPQGALPEGQSTESEQEFMRQQMMQVALMLEQQRVSGSEIPPELGAELARALKEYAGQQPVLPDEVGDQAASQKVVESGHEVASQDPLLNTKASNTADDALLNADSVRNQSAVPLATQSVPVDTGVAAAETARQTLVSTEQANQQPVLASDGKTAGVAGSEAVGADPKINPAVVAEKPPAAAQGIPETSTEQLKADAAQKTPMSEQAAKSEAVGRSAEVVTPARDPATVASSQAIQNANERVAVNSSTAPSNSALDEANANQQPQNRQQAGDVAVVKTTVDQQSAAAKAEAAKMNEAQGSPQVKPEPLPINKPEGQGVQKFESALDMTQQLLQKVSAGEKIDNSATQLVEKIANSSSLQPSTTQSLVMPTNAQKVATESQNLMMPQQVKINTPAWNNALGERAVMIAAQNTRVAEIQLDPPELGSLHVRVNVNQDQVSLSFTSPHAHVRDAVEQSLPRLREMFAEQGLALQDSSVSDHSSDQQRREQLADGSGNGGQYGTAGGVDGEAEVSEQAKRSVSLVDYYA